jgi:hypothetical protein
MHPLLLDPSQTFKGTSPQGLVARKVSNAQLPVYDQSHPLLSVSSSGILLSSWRYPIIPLRPYLGIVFLCTLRRSV